MTLFLPRPSTRTLYDSVSEGTAAVVIREYSSSFGLASRLLAEPVRTQVRNVYALVRVADEIVDNPDPALGRLPRAGCSTGCRTTCDTRCRAATAPTWSSTPSPAPPDPSGSTQAIVDPFFDSMRMDLETTVHTRESFDRYVHGSAEVVGLMCLRAFLAAPDASGGRSSGYDALAPGAKRLGAAFQKLNFLRDLAEDHDVLRPRLLPRTRGRRASATPTATGSSTTSTPTSTRPQPSSRRFPPAAAGPSVPRTRPSPSSARRLAADPGARDPPLARPRPRPR